jgi:hypothetical protein
MFVQVIQGRAVNADGIRSEMERWKAELEPGAEGWLGGTSGVTDDGRFIALARFESEEAARRNSQRPEQDAWWRRASQHLAEVAFHNSARVHLYKQGGSDEAGFVQVIQGHTDEMERLAEIARKREEMLAREAPHILGMTVVEHADHPGDFTQAVYFTSEEEARRRERERQVESDPEMAELMSLMRDLRYFDLRDPWLESPS